METTFIEFFNALPERFLLGIRFEASRYAMGTLGVFFTIWVLLGNVLRLRRIRQRRQSPIGQIKMELFNSFRTICVFVALDILIFDLASTGALKVYDEVADYGQAWYVASIVIAILLHDTYFYWTHRAMHHAKLYKRFHLTHHRSHNPTPFTAYSFAVGEAVVMYAYVPLMLLVLPLHESALAIVLLIMIFKNAIGHCGYELFPANTTKNPILKHLTTVTHHDMHHEKAGGNFGFYFTWWDRWMGTEHANYEDRFDAVTTQRARQTALVKPVGGGWT
jgi:sterol desaturase/sphingolipid hydroxylase (fatty acid hydroxylase superfamily)